ncbi:hypothetical protein [Microbacterium cremeum]|uniref:hypothetical protein n=1 Tax=Microbacterium cremeum TaxID=2782169 RepID=UPI001E2894CF|nr:hypothetical protein [Microbacterium cremeum]
MSTTGNEYERPGVNYPDREDAGGAAETPGAADPKRDEAPAAPPTMGEPDADAGEPPAANEGPSQGVPQSDGATPAAAEPSHEAVGIGVVDDGHDHHGHDDGRDTQTVSEAQQTPGGLGTEQEQRLPAMAQNNASGLEKVSGIVAQTRADVGTEPVERIAEVLRQRLDQAGVHLPDGDVQELARQVSTGDAESPTQS